MRRFFAVLSLCLFSAGCAGPEGEAGPEGPAGPAGPQGVPGPQGPQAEVLVSSLECTGSGTFGGVSVLFDVARHTYGDGSVLATCAVRDSSSEYGTTRLYEAGEAISCPVRYDVDTPSFGGWAFTFDAATATGTYSDAGSAFNGRVVSLTCTEG